MSSVGIWEEPSRQGIASKSREYSWQVQGTPDQLRLYTQARTCTLPTRPRLQKKIRFGIEVVKRNWTVDVWGGESSRCAHGSGQSSTFCFLLYLHRPIYGSQSLVLPMHCFPNICALFFCFWSNLFFEENQKIVEVYITSYKQKLFLQSPWSTIKFYWAIWNTTLPFILTLKNTLLQYFREKYYFP